LRRKDLNERTLKFSIVAIFQAHRRLQSRDESWGYPNSCFMK
jgi:hypothetical protein